MCVQASLRIDTDPAALAGANRRQPRPRRRDFLRIRTNRSQGAGRFVVPLADLFRNEPDIVVFAPGDVIIKAGEPGDAMFVILDGNVDIRLADKSVDVAGRGEIIGEMALVDRSSRSASIHALTPVRLARIDRRRFLYLVQNTPTFALDVMAVMASRIRRFDAAIAAGAIPPP
jgi:CRP/FNR family cyclic AMP-dependent transcriptional regulator